MEEDFNSNLIHVNKRHKNYVGVLHAQTINESSIRHMEKIISELQTIQDVDIFKYILNII